MPLLEHTPAHERRPTTDINSNAPVISRHEITIGAPLESVWLVHTEIDSWPQWNPDIAKAHLIGRIEVGAVFRWETAGMEIPSTIGEVVPLRKLAWSGEAGGILGIHVWSFWATAKGTHVRTEESWEGPSVPARVEETQEALDASLIGWLSSMKARAEAAVM
jgi:uncharacterized protein YndB with AHSA1/START domain